MTQHGFVCFTKTFLGSLGYSPQQNTEKKIVRHFNITMISISVSERATLQINLSIMIFLRV